MKNIYTQGHLLSSAVSRFAVVILCKVNQEMQFLEINNKEKKVYYFREKGIVFVN